MGTELLIGEIVNTNAGLIAGRLAENGFDAHYQVVVGDNLDRIAAALRTALARSEAVVVTGGLGPTQDDLTREAMCRVAGRTMVRDEDHATWISSRIRDQGRRPTERVLRMADLPQGAEGLPNASGVALGVAMETEDKWVFAVPGVPAEMITMLDNEVLPRLHRLDQRPGALVSRVLHIWGHGESAVADLLGDLYASTNPSVAFLIRDMEVRVRISARAEDRESAEALIGPFEYEIRDRLGSSVFASDRETVEEIVIRLLRERGWSLSTLEDATLGQVGARILSSRGGSDVFAGSLIPGPRVEVTPKADVVLEVGPIGPDRSNQRRTTRSVEMGLSTPGRQTGQVFEFGGDDERVRAFAAVAALHLLRLALEDH